ncbi:MAG: hypothetical protein HY553_01255 [Elusimicrobia bacterium]|nr:hypothetical protein [Elusimicrobiota bacterium]
MKKNALRVLALLVSATCSAQARTPEGIASSAAADFSRLGDSRLLLAQASPAPAVGRVVSAEARQRSTVLSANIGQALSGLYVARATLQIPIAELRAYLHTYGDRGGSKARLAELERSLSATQAKIDEYEAILLK